VLLLCSGWISHPFFPGAYRIERGGFGFDYKSVKIYFDYSHDTGIRIPINTRLRNAGRIDGRTARTMRMAYCLALMAFTDRDMKIGKQSVGGVLGIILVTLMAGCVTDTAVTTKPSAPISKVALVSFAVTNWGGIVSGTGGDAKAAELINHTLSEMVAYTENRLTGYLRISRASGFVGSVAYRNLGVKNELDLLLPKENGQPFALFSKDNDDVIAANLAPAVAKKLCAELQVDAVVVVYSEWAVTMGKTVKAQRALARVVVSVWDSSGNLVFTKRAERTGTGILGAPYSPVVANEYTIGQWSSAYFRAFDQIVAQMKPALKP